MRTIRIKLYKFNELSEDAKQKALDKLYDVNVMFDWWENTYEDAKQIGLTINESDFERGCKGELDFSGLTVANNILNSHGESCETYKTAKTFIEDYNKVFVTYPINEDEEGYDQSEYDRDKEIEDLEEEFNYSLLEDYRIILQNEYEYLTGKEAIIDTIEANEYEFTKDGKLN